MKPIKATDFFEWLQGELTAFCSILRISETYAKELLDGDKELDTAYSRLAAHLMQTHPKPVNGADALLLALERVEMKLEAMVQAAQSLAPTLEL
jgi:hypothetical protein